jgi:hypothetical protein
MIVDDNASHHSKKTKNSHVSFEDCCGSSIGGSTCSLLSNGYTMFNQSIEQRKLFHKDDRWSTSSSSSSLDSPSPSTQSSKSPCALPLHRKSVATRGEDEQPGCQTKTSTSLSIYYCPLMRDDDEHGRANNDESSTFRRVRRPRRLRENKWDVRQERRNSLSSMSSSDSSSSTFADLPPRMPSRQA